MRRRAVSAASERGRPASSRANSSGAIAPGGHREHGAHEDAHHVAHEGVRLDPEGEHVRRGSSTHSARSHVALEAHVVGLGGREGGEVVACPAAPRRRRPAASRSSGARPPERPRPLERARLARARARGSDRSARGRRAGRRSRPAPARSAARSRRPGSSPLRRARLHGLARRGSPPARARARRCRCARPRSAPAAGARSVSSASSSTPCTVRRPGWRAHPANPEPSYSSRSRAVSANRACAPRSGGTSPSMRTGPSPPLRRRTMLEVVGVHRLELLGARAPRGRPPASGRRARAGRRTPRATRASQTIERRSISIRAARPSRRSRTVSSSPHSSALVGIRGRRRVAPAAPEHLDG